MKANKLDAVQKHKLKLAYSNASEVLSMIKLKKLNQKQLEEMKLLEEATQILEILMLENLKIINE